MVGLRSLSAAAAPELPLIAHDAFHPVANDTPRPVAGVLPGIAPVLDDTLPLIDPVLDAILLALNGTLPHVAGVLDDHRPGIEQAVQRGRLADPLRWSYSSLLRQLLLL